MESGTLGRSQGSELWAALRRLFSQEVGTEGGVWDCHCGEALRLQRHLGAQVSGHWVSHYKLPD